jgi:DNA-binding GntR family transcriptional regulator
MIEGILSRNHGETMPDAFSAVGSFQTKEDFVYTTLRAAILQCELAPGEKLVVDRLSTRLGTSTIPVRTALQRLQAEGLVDIVPHTGAVVSGISTGLVTEVFTLLEALESVAFAQAAKNVKTEDLAGLQKILREMDQALQNRDANLWSDLNSRFHRAVAEITGMKLLIEFTNRTLDNWDRLRRYFFKQESSDRLPRAQVEHRQMLDLLRKGDEQALIAAAIKHNREARDAYRNPLVPAGMEPRGALKQARGPSSPPTHPKKNRSQRK